MLRTCRNAKHAERAASKIIEILVELAFLLAVGKIDHLCLQMNRAVRTVHLADAAADAAVTALFVVDKGQFGPEPVGDLKGLPVFGILLRDLRGHELFAGDTHAGHKALYALPHLFKIF